jgi:DnaJ-class molecular chaperone
MNAANVANTHDDNLQAYLCPDCKGTGNSQTECESFCQSCLGSGVNPAVFDKEGDDIFSEYEDEGDWYE